MSAVATVSVIAIAFRRVALSAGVVLLAGCATGTLLSTPFSEATPREKDGVVIYVYRLPSIVGAAVPWAVRLDGARVASIRSGSYTVVYTTAGPRMVTVADKMPTLLGAVLDASFNKGGVLEAKPGGVYFLRNSGFTVNYVSREDAMKELATLPFDPSQ